MTLPVVLNFSADPASSSVNQSWICPYWPNELSEWPVKVNNNSGAINSGCLFLFQQQLNRPPALAAFFEFPATVAIWLTSIPTNIFAIANFHKRDISKGFLFIIFVHAFCNFLITTFGAIRGLARLYDDYFLGDFGCSLLFGSSTAFMTAIIWLHCIMSVERFVTVRSLFPAVSAQRRFVFIVSAVALTFCVIAAFYLYLFGFYGSTAFTFRAHVDHIGVIRLCVVVPEKVPHHIVQLAIFFALTFFTPIAITATNYIMIWRFVRRSSKRSRLYVRIRRLSRQRLHRLNNVTNGAKLLTARRGCNNNAGENRRQAEAGLSLLTLTSVLLFVVSTLPAHIVFVYIQSYDSAHGMTAQSSLFFYCLCLVQLDAVLNPFLQSLLNPSKSPSWLAVVFAICFSSDEEKPATPHIIDDLMQPSTSNKNNRRESKFGEFLSVNQTRDFEFTTIISRVASSSPTNSDDNNSSAL